MKKKLFYLKIFVLVFFFKTLSIDAQEYATDRLFMKHLKKASCLRIVEERVNNLKTKREMTLEHELLLNNNIWNKIRTKLPLSNGEKKRLFKLRENCFSSKTLNSKKLWAMKEKKFNELRSECK